MELIKLIHLWIEVRCSITVLLKLIKDTKLIVIQEIYKTNKINNNHIWNLALFPQGLGCQKSSSILRLTIIASFHLKGLKAISNNKEKVGINQCLAIKILSKLVVVQRKHLQWMKCSSQHNNKCLVIREINNL